jgi:hypothetical protein
MSVSEMAAYAKGAQWADENLNRLRERFTGVDMQTQDLRDILWPTAERIYKPERESMENDLHATAWVAGAMKRLVDTMEWSREGMAAIFEAALEMGSIFSAEFSKHEALEEIKAKPRNWWSKKAGELTPNDIMEPILQKWWRDVGVPEERTRTSRAEALKHVLGAREMRAFTTLKRAAQEGGKNDVYVYYDVDGEGVGFQIMAKDAVHPGGIVSQRAGDIVG